jgi:hypothetical protein
MIYNVSLRRQMSYDSGTGANQRRDSERVCQLQLSDRRCGTDERAVILAADRKSRRELQLFSLDRRDGAGQDGQRVQEASSYPQIILGYLDWLQAHAPQ